MRKGIMVLVVFWVLCTLSQELYRAFISCSHVSAGEIPGVRRTLRDPFVPPHMESIQPGKDEKKNEVKKVDVKKKSVTIKTIPPPPFSLTGIIMGGNRASAIVFHPEMKSSYILTIGETMGDYRITSITPERIVMKRQLRTFQLELHKG